MWEDKLVQRGVEGRKDHWTKRVSTSQELQLSPNYGTKNNDTPGRHRCQGSLHASELFSAALTARHAIWRSNYTVRISDLELRTSWTLYTSLNQLTNQWEHQVMITHFSCCGAPRHGTGCLYTVSTRNTDEFESASFGLELEVKVELHKKISVTRVTLFFQFSTAAPLDIWHIPTLYMFREHTGYKPTQTAELVESSQHYEPRFHLGYENVGTIHTV